MQLELIILFEVIAFLFLALGIIPYRKDESSGSLPLMNKLIFVIVSAILFFVLAVVGSSYEISRCSIVEESNPIDNDPIVYTSECSMHLVDDSSLSYINTGMGWLSILLALVIMLFTITSRNDRNYQDEEQ